MLFAEGFTNLRVWFANQKLFGFEMEDLASFYGHNPQNPTLLLNTHTFPLQIYHLKMKQGFHWLKISHQEALLQHINNQTQMALLLLLRMEILSKFESFGVTSDPKSSYRCFNLLSRTLNNMFYSIGRVSNFIHRHGIKLPSDSECFWCRAPAARQPSHSSTLQRLQTFQCSFHCNFPWLGHTLSL